MERTAHANTGGLTEGLKMVTAREGGTINC